jgi:hypothetical protein
VVEYQGHFKGKTSEMLKQLVFKLTSAGDVTTKVKREFMRSELTNLLLF